MSCWFYSIIIFLLKLSSHSTKQLNKDGIYWSIIRIIKFSTQYLQLHFQLARCILKTLCNVILLYVSPCLNTMYKSTSSIKIFFFYLTITLLKLDIRRMCISISQIPLQYNVVFCVTYKRYHTTLNSLFRWYREIRLHDFNSVNLYHLTNTDRVKKTCIFIDDRLRISLRSLNLIVNFRVEKKFSIILYERFIVESVRFDNNFEIILCNLIGMVVSNFVNRSKCQNNFRYFLLQ